MIVGLAWFLLAQEIADQAVNEWHPALIVLVVYGNLPSVSTQYIGSAKKIASLISLANPDH